MNANPTHAATGKFRYLFGPVPSRRLGLSLGIDLLVPKTCSYDCVFCEVGRTTDCTMARREYAPVPGIVAELAAWRKQGGTADRITVAGSGEPTLHSRFGEVLDAIRQGGTIPSALLTNGSLLHLPEVRAAAAKANLVKASLSAWDQESFEAVNKPHPDLRFEKLVEGLVKFRSEFRGEYWIEVILMAGMNDAPEDVKKIGALVAQIRPDKVHLNTVVRPPAFLSARAVAREKLEELTLLFHPAAEAIAGFGSVSGRPGKLGEHEIVAMVVRRPCTLKDMTAAFGVERAGVESLVKELTERGELREERRGIETYYRIAGR